jgi:hypothetical protein
VLNRRLNALLHPHPVDAYPVDALLKDQQEHSGSELRTVNRNFAKLQQPFFKLII